MENAKRYEVVRKIAQGGMAEIFLARQSGVGGFRRHIVLKRILPAHAKDRNWVASFLNEAALAAALNHPNIVQIYDVGRHKDSYIMAMEYIDGSDLETLLKAHRDVGSYMPLRVALTYLSDVLCALDYAHDAVDIDGKPLGLIHRDVSTSNVMVTSEGQAKILDFGIAKMFEPKNDVEKTQVGVVRGKATCLSPEQVRGQQIDRRVDVHACGVLFYELLTNQNPFKDPDQIQTLRNVLELKPMIPEARAAEIPEAIRHVLDKALAKDRNDRFASCGAMLAALELAMERCGYGVSRTAARNYMRATTHDTDALRIERKPERTLGEIEVPEEKTKNVLRPVAPPPPPVAVEEDIQPTVAIAPIARSITPTSLATFELDDVIAPGDPSELPTREALKAEASKPEPRTLVRDVRWRRAIHHHWAHAVGAAAFVALMSLQAWPRIAEAPTIAANELPAPVDEVSTPAEAAAPQPDKEVKTKRTKRAKRR